jgi:hypothetical protein
LYPVVSPTSKIRSPVPKALEELAVELDLSPSIVYDPPVTIVQ